MLTEHMAEVITTHFNKDGNLLLTGSFDSNAFIWDLRSKEYVIHATWFFFSNYVLVLQNSNGYERSFSRTE